MRILTIDNKTITDDSPCYVIAEIGHNHGGNLNTCKQLFKAGKECGADAVKLQKRNNKKLFTKAAYNAPYDNENSYGATYGEHREALEFGWDEYVELKAYAKDLGITFFATAFDLDSLGFLVNLDVPAIKIASWDLSNIRLIEYASYNEVPLILSTGGHTLQDIRRSFHILADRQHAFLHCISNYPNQANELNLKIIPALRKYFPDTVIGFSNHYSGIVPCMAAYLMGARIIETHFTLNHAWKGTDHALSLEPQGLRQLVENLRIIRESMGDGVKRKLPSEEKAIHKMANAVHIAKSIPGGHKITEDDICLKAPADGLAPYEWEDVLGKITICDLSTADVLAWEALK